MKESIRPASARPNKPETSVAGFQQSTNRHEFLVTRRNWFLSQSVLSCHRQFNQLNESDASRCRSAAMGFKQFPKSRTASQWSGWE
jgi:hypothetical protein